jgi:hypothetical protein
MAKTGFSANIEYADGGSISLRQKRGQAGMSPIEMLLHAGSDFMKNKFDAALVWFGGEGGEIKSTEDWQGLIDVPRLTSAMSPIEKAILSTSGFVVRIGDVTIPTSYNDDFEIPFLSTTISKVKSTKVTKTISQFSFRPDEGLFWIENFQNLAARTVTVDGYFKSPAEDNHNPFVAGLSQSMVDNLGAVNYRRILRNISSSFGPSPIQGKTAASAFIRSMRLCLIVQMRHLSNFINPASQQRMLPFFVFENVKILGVEGNINFSIDASTPPEITVPFIFRRVYQFQPALSNATFDGEGKPTKSEDFERARNLPFPPTGDYEYPIPEWKDDSTNPKQPWTSEDLRKMTIQPMFYDEDGKPFFSLKPVDAKPEQVNASALVDSSISYHVPSSKKV